jgi:hypothetical protein
MLDVTGILFSSLMMLFVVVRAVRLDRTQPWFQTLSAKAGKEAPVAPARRPRG